MGQIEVGENSSYHVTGVPLEGHADAGDDYWLCRCGGSDTKPFCSSAHETNGFDGTETAPTGTFAERAKTLSPGLLDDRSICGHAGKCATRITNVWKAAKTLEEDAELRATVKAMVDTCPSGALVMDDEPDLGIKITVEPNGPYHVTGGIEIRRADGVDFEARNRVLLCRCGQSKNKPLCDGTHKEVGFTG